MNRISDEALSRSFLGWQCRIRQISVREHGGRPLAAMRPRVLLRSGEVVLPAMTTLIVPKEPSESTAFFRFQVLKSADARAIYDGAMKHLQAGYFQEPETFSDALTALFAPDSAAAAGLVKAKACLLEFDQFSQRWLLRCAVKKLPVRDARREHTLWHNRLFNPDVPGDAMVLAFTPDWKSAHADPMPAG